MSNEHPESVWASLYGSGKLIGSLRARLCRAEQWNINKDITLTERSVRSSVRLVLAVEVGVLS